LALRFATEYQKRPFFSGEPNASTAKSLSFKTNL